MKKFLAFVLTLLLVVTMLPAAAMAAESTDNRGNRYDHIDVRVDATYGVSIDGQAYTFTGKVDASSISVSVTKNGTTKSYSGFDDDTQSDGGMLEYSKSVGRGSLSASDVDWVGDTFYMNGVTVSAKIYITNFGGLPDNLKDVVFSKDSKGYYVALTNYTYTGVQECTYGNGLRSAGNEGEASGLDLYIQASGAALYITKGKLAIKKEVVDESGAAISDNGEFTFTITGPNSYSNTVTVKAGETLTLENLAVGRYTITEVQKAGYIIKTINGAAAGTNYSVDYTVENKTDSDIPIATFTNTKLSTTGGISLRKTASGIDDGSYPTPTVVIKDSSGAVVWEGTLTPNGDTKYYSPLQPGTYTIEETVPAPAAGYKLASATLNGGTAMSFTVTAGSVTALVLNNVYETVPTTGSITVTKAFAGALDAEDVGSVDITVSDGTSTWTQTLNADNEWTYTFTGLAPGGYTVSESADVNGYALSAAWTGDIESGTITVVAGENEAVTVTNTYTRITDTDYEHDSVSGLKTDEGEQPLGGAVFTVCDADGNAIGTYTSDANGAFTIATDDAAFADLLPAAGADATFTMSETTAPAGYTGSASEWSIVISAAKTTATEPTLVDNSYVFVDVVTYTITVDGDDSVAVVNEINTDTDYVHDSITVTKTDGTSALAGAAFGIYTDEECSGDAVYTFTAGTAEISTEDLESVLPAVGSNGATLYLKETAAPAGYTADDTVWTITILAAEGDAVLDPQRNAFVTTVTYTITVDGEDSLTVANEKITATEYVHDYFGLKKTDGTNILLGATFGVYTDAECSGDALYSFNAGNVTVSTEVSFFNAYLPDAGESVTLYVKETAAPNGYKVGESVWPIVITATAGDEVLTDGVFVTTVTYTITIDGGEELAVANEKITATEYVHDYFGLKKTDGTNVLLGATFSVYTDEECSGSSIYSFKAGNVTISTENSSLKAYLPEAGETVTLYIKEAAAPDGYKGVDTVWPIVITAVAGDEVLKDNAFVTTITYTITIDGKEDLTVVNAELIDVTVKKLWVDGNSEDRPTSVTAVLSKDGVVYDTQKLSSANDWTYTWTDLDPDAEWTVDEQSVPSGYYRKVEQSGNTFTISNIINEIPDTGDTANIGPWAALLALATGCIGAVLHTPKKRRSGAK